MDNTFFIFLSVLGFIRFVLTALLAAWFAKLQKKATPAIALTLHKL